MENFYSLNIRFKNKIKKFPWRQKHNRSEFLALVANTFNLKAFEKNFELKDSNGFFYYLLFETCFYD